METDWKIAYTKLALDVTNIQGMLNDFAEDSIKRLDLETAKRLIKILMATHSITDLVVAELSISE